MKKKISPLTYLLINYGEHKLNASGYAYTSTGECKKKLFLSDKDIQCDPNKKVDLLNNAIATNPIMQNKEKEINDSYTDYKAKGGTKPFQKYLDEDYYKTEEGKDMLASLDQVGGLLSGLFGNQEAPETNIGNNVSKTKIAGVSPVWLIIIILAVLASLIALFIVAGGGKSKKSSTATTVTQPAQPAPTPQLAPPANPVPSNETGVEF